MNIQRKKMPEINAGSMADIAFLLLIFFLVTTNISDDKGLQILLPPKREAEDTQAKVKEHNVLRVLINHENKLLVENESLPIEELKEKAKKFINNFGKDKTLSDNPEKGVISLRADRGTKYEAYIAVIDQLKTAYHELRAEHMGISPEEYLMYDPKRADTGLKKKYEAAKKAFPLNISEQEPTSIQL